MRFRNLDVLKRPEPFQVSLGTLPRDILMTRFAMEKAFAVNRLVRSIHGDSFEWYGYTIARKERVDVIVDIGIPENDKNRIDYTALDPVSIQVYQESLRREEVINGWVHSHGNLPFHSFSSTDDQNSMRMLDFVFSRLKISVAKREIFVDDLLLLVEGRHTDQDLVEGSIAIVTDAPVTRARILETVYGGFCHCLVIGDEGWHAQEIVYKERGILSGHTSFSRKRARLLITGDGGPLGPEALQTLAREVRAKIKPLTHESPKLERA